MSKKLVIFGGSFDPVHNGHYEMYLAVKKALKPNLFIVVPNNRPPLKKHKNVATKQQRFLMLQTVFGKDSDVLISKYELKKPKCKVSYTFKTIKHFAKKYQGHEIYLMMGADRYQDFELWKNAKKIKELATLVVLNRSANPIKTANDVINVEMPVVPTSSTELRKVPNSRFLNSEIVEFIRQVPLYIEDQVKIMMTEYRYCHTLKVAKTAVKIAKKVRPDLCKKAYIAAMYHDVAKEFDEAKIKEWTKDIKKAQVKFPNWHTKHGWASANYIHSRYNINDREILEAVRNHVIPAKEIGDLAKILYCADKLEPSRSRKEMPQRRKLLKLIALDIDRGFNELVKIIKRRYSK